MHFKRGPVDHGVTNNSVASVRRQAGAECLLLDSGKQLHACPLSYRTVA